VHLHRTSSGSGDSFKARAADGSDGNDSDLDLAGLRRARMQHPGTISMFGSFSDKAMKDAPDDGQETASTKLRMVFELPKEEKILMGTEKIVESSANARISGMAREECYDTGLYVPYRKIHMFLCPTATDRRTLVFLNETDGRILSLKRATSPRNPETHLDGIESGLC